MLVPRVEKVYEKHAWIFLFALGVFFLILGSARLSQGLIGLTFTGQPLSQLGPVNAAVANYIKVIAVELGFTWFFLSFLIIGGALKSYRKGEKWTWYVFWSLPVFAVAVTSLFGFGPPAVIILVLSLLGLLLPYRKFFPRK